MFTAHPLTRFGGITLAERVTDARRGPADLDTDAHVLAGILHYLPRAQLAGPTRTQFADACRKSWPRASVFVGGHHVAVHLNGDDTRNLLFTGCTADWS